MFLCSPVCSAVSVCLTDSCALQVSILLLLLCIEYQEIFFFFFKCPPQLKFYILKLSVVHCVIGMFSLNLPLIRPIRIYTLKRKISNTKFDNVFNWSGHNDPCKLSFNIIYWAMCTHTYIIQGHSMVTFVTKIWEIITFNWSQLLQQTSYQSFCGWCTKYLGWSIHSNPPKN